VGDFEDTDLCLKLRERGYRCIVDPRISLFHLERQSQAGSGVSWRMNLTLYNAWQHERRWGKTIEMTRERRHAATGGARGKKHRHQTA
jgi:GT2 family glycosyltransferase